MHVLFPTSVDDALQQGLSYLRDAGLAVATRNGPALKAHGPVTTVYREPQRRVLLDGQRDANPFFHLFESLWILSGRRDVAFLAQFNKKIADYSDDGEVFHGAYGWRLRCQQRVDQIEKSIELLRANHGSRQVVMQIWDANLDLGTQSKDIPCNDLIMLSVFDDEKGGKYLDMTVNNRSNDIVWGAYGANAVQFSVLQEYIAARVGIRVGRYHQVSNNYHVYTELPFWKAWLATHSGGVDSPNLYETLSLEPTNLFEDVEGMADDVHLIFDTFDDFPTATMNWISKLRGKKWTTAVGSGVLMPMLEAFRIYKTTGPAAAIDLINREMASESDWAHGARLWLNNRASKA